MSAPLAELELRNRIAYALSAAGAYCGDCGFEPGDRGTCADCERCWSSYADALLPLFATARDARVTELEAEIERLRMELRTEKTWFKHKARGERHQRQRADHAARDLRRLRTKFSAAFEEIEGVAERLDRAVRGCARYRARIAELEAQAALVAEFVAARAEYVTAIRNCHPDNGYGYDYDRWQGHAAARRQLAETLGLSVAWPAEGGAE